jgi:hypothetical protein
MSSNEKDSANLGTSLPLSNRGKEAPNVLSRTRKGGGGRSRSAQEQRVITLEARLRQREEALAELMTEYVALKKRSTGEA